MAVTCYKNKEKNKTRRSWEIMLSQSGGESEKQFKNVELKRENERETFRRCPLNKDVMASTAPRKDSCEQARNCILQVLVQRLPGTG